MTLSLRPLTHFALALLKGTLNDLRMLVMTMFTPLLLLVLFWLLTRDGDKGATLMAFMFPGIVGFAVMQAGQPLALRIVSWRQQGLFQRLACAPVPLGHLVLGAALAQTLLALAQGVFMMLFGVLVLGLPINAVGAAISVLALTLGSACFIAFGALTSTLAAKPETANMVFIFTIMPLYFLGGGMPPEVLPDFLRALSPWLPSTLLTDLLHSLFATGQLPDAPVRVILGLLAYTIVFALIAARKFRWE